MKWTIPPDQWKSARDRFVRRAKRNLHVTETNAGRLKQHMDRALAALAPALAEEYRK